MAGRWQAQAVLRRTIRRHRTLWLFTDADIARLGARRLTRQQDGNRRDASHDQQSSGLCQHAQKRLGAVLEVWKKRCPSLGLFPIQAKDYGSGG
jgi:hypothetical protein